MDRDHRAAATAARQYYNSPKADTFYRSIWGGEHIHNGIYENEHEPIAVASQRTVDLLAGRLDLPAGAVVLDLGSGYGGSARHLARTFDCSVVGLNVSDVENRRSRALLAEQGLSDKVTVIDGSYEDIPFADATFDVAWSLDAFLHSGNRHRVLSEISRILKPGGRLVFTDPMVADGAPCHGLQPILGQKDLDTMGSPGFYQRALAGLGLVPVTGDGFEPHNDQLPLHYHRVRQEAERWTDWLESHLPSSYVDHMKRSCAEWVDAGRQGRLAWGIFDYVC